MRSWHVNGADDVDLVVFERYVALVDVYDVVCVVYPESETDGMDITTQNNTNIHRNTFRSYFDKRKIETGSLRSQYNHSFPRIQHSL
jgi:hypothetical protein